MKLKNYIDYEDTANPDIKAIQLKNGKWRLYEYSQWIGYHNGFECKLSNPIKDHSGAVLNFDTLTDAQAHASKIK